jgi:cell division protein FtsW
MNGFAVEGAKKKGSWDHALILSIVLLTGAGLVTLYSASASFAQRFFNDRWYFVIRQSILAAFGLFFFILIIHIRLDTVRKWIGPLVIGTIILCFLPFVPFIGGTINGASRWIRIGGRSFQPSELVKLVLPIYLAHLFDKKKDNLAVFSKGILPPTCITALFFTLIYLQNNFSTALFVALNALVIFFLAGIKMRYFLSATVILMPISFLLVLTKEHRLRRFISFIWPEWEPLGAGYQVNASVLTIRSGGFWGKGLGQGTRKIASVPEIHSDFIFSAFSEEGGFIGVVLFLLIFLIFAWRGYHVALRSNDTFKRLLTCGLVTTVVTQMLLNIAVVSASLPATGVPLPFFSAGGSSLFITLVICAFIVNVSRSEGENAI